MTPAEKIEVLNQSLFLLWGLLLVLALLSYERIPQKPGKKAKNIEFCKLHSRPLYECRYMHGPPPK